MSFPLKPGETIARAELHALAGGGPSGRIRPSKVTPSVLMFTSPGEHDSQNDGWTGTHYHFQGAGQGGSDQQIKGVNRSVVDHEKEKRTLRLFAAAPGGLVRYLGAYRVDQDQPYVEVALPVIGDPGHPQRIGYVFRLLPERDTPIPVWVPSAHGLSATTTVRERDLYLPYRPSPGSEKGRKLTSIEDSANVLLRDYCDYLRLLGRDVHRVDVTPAGELTPLPVDIFDRTANEIVACAGSVARTHVLAAVGELLDMRRFFDPTPGLVMLTPSKPRPDLADLCSRLSITGVWRDGGRTFRRCEPGDGGEG